MTWFKVDDSLHSHKKAMRAGPDAMGLWVLAGSWSADQLTDGWVPDYAALRLTPRADELAAQLVKAGLWEPAEHDGETGWMFHGWDDYQPSRADVEARRRSDAERRARWRHSKEAPPQANDTQQESDTESRDVSRRDSREESREVSSLPDPTRPDPSSPNGELPPCSPPEGDKPKRATRIPDDFAVTDEMVEWAREHTPLVGRAETDKFVDYWQAKSGKDATKRDWVATWRNWMRRAQEDAERRSSRRTSRPSSKDERVDALDAFLVDEPQTVLRALPGGAA